MMPKSYKEFVQEARDMGIPEIDAGQLQEKFDRGDSFVLIDVRDPDEWEAGTIPRAVLLSKGKLELKIAETVSDPNQEIILHCGGGSRSLIAARSLKEMGYPNVISLAGGYRGWKEYKGKD